MGTNYFTATPLKGGVIVLSWARPGSPPVAITLIRDKPKSPSNSSDDYKINVPIDMASYIDTGLLPETLYSYRLLIDNIEYPLSAACITLKRE